MVSALATGIAIFGSLIGSFLNVVIYRVPAGHSIVSPPSACGNCGARIRAWDNIPIISWLLLRGQCRDCRAHISVRYPLVELGGAVFFAAVALRFVPTIVDATSPASGIASVLVLVAFLYLSAISLALALIDIDTRRLPNAIVLPAYIVGAVMLGGASIVGAHYPALLGAAVGALALALLYLALALVYPGGMGFGDVKLAGVIGLFLGWLGWDVLIVGALAAFLLGGLFGVGLLVSRAATGKTGIPFGPWMLGGAWLGILAGPQLAAGYLAIFGLRGL